ncbi:RICIN domain-containing protein [Streptomyces sp. WZ-12]|uniref:RICIN domain-containing protein n=1 Tax=Streptomyces sp. WZ-12 TaxID=3030210 RepID=UPI00238179FC|nr:RICIN domain-containing protein [Streptomyces sp. WZ-12]
MSRITRAALAIGAGVAALAGSVTTAHADTDTPRAAVQTSVVQLQAAHSGKCLTIADGSFRNGANAVQSTCTDGADSQLFELVPTGSATFEVRAKHSGKCLEVENSGTQAGANVQQWWCVDGSQMRWRLVMVDVTKELYELRPMHTDLRCLDIKDSSLKDGANAQSWYCNSTAAQRWQLKPAGA